MRNSDTRSAMCDPRTDQVCGSVGPIPGTQNSARGPATSSSAATTHSTSRVCSSASAPAIQNAPDTLSQTVIRTKFCGVLRPVPAHRPDREERAPHLDQHERDREQQRLALERLRDRARHQQPQPHEDQQHRADRHLVRVQPVGHPRGVDPQPPHRPAQDQRVHERGQVGVRDEAVRQLRDREHEHQVEEQLHVADPAAVVAVAVPQHVRPHAPAAAARADPVRGRRHGRDPATSV